jgi:WD40 repeat protein
MYGTVAIIKLDGVAHQIAFGAAGNFALAEQRDEILIVDMKRHKAIEAYNGHEADVTAVALSATEPLALSGDDDGELQLWEVATLKRRKKLRAHKDTINAVALSPNGKLALTGGVDGRIRLWDLATGERISLEHADWADYEEEITYVAFSRDGDKFVAGGSGGRTSLWETETGDRIKRFPGLELPISCVRVSDEGGQILATTQPIEHRGTSYLIIAHWDAKTGKPINQFNIAVETVPCCIAPDRGGKRVVIGGGQGDPWMGIWSLQDGRCLYAFDHFRGTPLSLAVSPHNNRLLAALDSARLQVFGLETS